MDNCRTHDRLFFMWCSHHADGGGATHPRLEVPRNVAFLQNPTYIYIPYRHIGGAGRNTGGVDRHIGGFIVAIEPILQLLRHGGELVVHNLAHETYVICNENQKRG